jgi:hypothetical protein
MLLAVDDVDDGVDGVAVGRHYAPEATWHD